MRKGYILLGLALFCIGWWALVAHYVVTAIQGVLHAQ